MSPQEKVLAFNIKGILHIAGRMIGREVEGLEIIVIGLDFRTAGDGETHITERAAHVIDGFGNGMDGPDAVAFSGQGRVEGGFRLPAFEFIGGDFDGLLDFGPGFISGGPDFFAIIRREVFETPQNGRNFAFAPEIFDIYFFELFFGLHRGNGLESLLADALHIIYIRHGPL
jgi:hypothetical protein